MSLPSPVCTVNGGAPPVAVAAGATLVTIALANPSGANYWSIAATSTDETNSAAAVNATLVVNMTAKTATFTAPASLGSSVIFTSTVGIQGLGIDSNRESQPALTTTFKVNVLTTGGQPVMAANEALEQNATFGWIVEINQFIRAGGGGIPTSATTRVSVVHSASPFAALDYTRHIVDVSGGPVDVQLQAGKASGVRVMVQISVGPVGETNKLRVLAPGGGTVEDTIEHAGAGMSMGATSEYNTVGELGAANTYECDGANHWTIVS